MEITTRKPAVAGRFYPGNPSSVITLLNQLITAEKEKINYQYSSMPIIGGIVPHAGLVFSGYQAVHFYEMVRNSRQQFDTVVIINPNHSGNGSGLFNTSSYNYWETPLGTIEADKQFIDALDIESNNQAHDNEHSGEVQLPFLQYLFQFPYRLVMITMNSQNNESSTLLADKIYNAVKLIGRNILVIASSDFNHYESPEIGFQKDQHIIDKIINLDSDGVYTEVKKYRITACGYGPIMTLLNYAKLVTGKPEVKMLKRGHSGEIYPSEEVVDYVSFLVVKGINA